MSSKLLTFLGMLFTLVGTFIYFRTNDMTDLILYLIISNMYFIYSDYKATNVI